MKGFTLIETLVTIGITLVLSAMALSYNRSSERQLIVYRDQQSVIGLLNQARSLTAQRYRDPSISGYVSCAFGVHIEPDSRDYVLFRDLASGDCGSANYRYDPGVIPSEAINTLSLDRRLLFEGIPISGLDIFFVPPDITADSSAGLPTSFVIRTEDDSFRVTTTVAAGGQIVVE